MSGYEVRVYNSKGEYYANEQTATESEALDLAVRWTTGKGQQTWTAHVFSGGERAASFRGGKGFTPRGPIGRRVGR